MPIIKGKLNSGRNTSHYSPRSSQKNSVKYQSTESEDDEVVALLERSQAKAASDLAMFKANYKAEEAVRENIQNQRDIAKLEKRIRQFGVI